MSQEANPDQKSDAQESAVENQPEQPQEVEEQPIQSEDQPQEQLEQTPKKQTNEEYMRTMEHHNDYDNIPDNKSGGTNLARTQGNFHPRSTFHARSTERSGAGSRRFSKLTSGWNDRFHMSPSTHNKKSHTFYKEFFSKPTRSTQTNILRHKKFIDPYLLNERKSRIPKYSKLYKQRDFQGELNWVDNFSVTSSKNNGQLHHTYKEYFDKPLSYKGHITVATK
uniref:Uncharacterized protein n=1 Tax=Euplotes crassus TaxID=5936 RepID=A0A7S3KDK4_EUPCR|mmetsp:Transcript_22077/g.21857  ORF Transcript_22077/g.21857 Transcript_22077/m.21857 type:complete len:223 (+) Transcript_22077:19-687(+)